MSWEPDERQQAILEKQRRAIAEANKRAPAQRPQGMNRDKAGWPIGLPDEPTLQETEQDGQPSD